MNNNMCESDVSQQLNISTDKLEKELDLLKSLGLLTIVVSSNGAVFMTISPNLVKDRDSLSYVEVALKDVLKEIKKMKSAHVDK